MTRATLHDHGGGRDDVALGTVKTPVGPLAVAVTRTGLAGVSWAPRPAIAPAAGLPITEDPARVAPILEQLRAYFHGARHQFDVAIDWRQTSGPQQTVLQTLHATVPYGTSVTYGQLADRSGTSIPARGIGAIMGSNPLPVVVPCHRVLAHDGIGGYSGGAGVEIKRWLLALEGVLPPTLDWDPADARPHSP